MKTGRVGEEEHTTVVRGGKGYHAFIWAEGTGGHGRKKKEGHGAKRFKNVCPWVAVG